MQTQSWQGIVHRRRTPASLKASCGKASKCFSISNFTIFRILSRLRARLAARLGVWMLNVHALGGSAMLEAARRAVDVAAQRPKLIAVTVLTSMGNADLKEVGIEGDAAAVALRLAKLSQKCGLDGVVCSAQEATLLKRDCGAGFCLVARAYDLQRHPPTTSNA
jgi:orotidine-5'-phosphate decarboxylase